MSWKRCWNSGYNHNFYESDFDEQIVPDIDRRPTSSSSSSLSSTSSMDASSTSSASVRGNIDTHFHHNYHHQVPLTSSYHTSTVAGPAATGSPTLAHRVFPLKRENNSSGNEASGSGIFGQHQRNADNNSTHYRHSSALQSAINSAGNYSSTSHWSSHKSPHNMSEFFGSRNGEKRSGLELNDFWEEKYSRIAVITTTNHFGQTMSNKL